MSIRTRNDDGVVSYSLMDMESLLKEESSAFLLDTYIFAQCPHVLSYDDDFMHEESVINLFSWIHKQGGSATALHILDFVKSNIKKVQKRAYSTTHRIEVAYRSKYKCNMCDLLLPPTFQIDHIKELQDGGEDTYENCQALCPNCHAEKTRANILRRDKAFERVFGKRFERMQVNAFQTFRSTSKYF